MLNIYIKNETGGTQEMKKNYNDYAVDELVAQYKQDKNERVFAEIMEKQKD